MKILNDPKIQDLMNAILTLKDSDEAKRFFRDLLTEQELLEFSKRWQTAQLLKNKTPYTTIEKKTGLSSTTIARVARWLNKGMGGYQLALNRTHHTNPSGK
jgi:TrpR-related protein YerC/YecD